MTMKTTTLLLLCLSALSLQGCYVSEEKHAAVIDQLNDLKQEIKSVKSELGDFRYQSLDPKIKFSIKDVEFLKPERYSASPSVKFKASLKQTNPSFPLDHYSINVTLSVLDETGNAIHDVGVYSEVENGVLSLAEEESLYGLNTRDTSGYTLSVKSYEWFPVQNFLPYKT